jgi:16S rRNA processing protein RimM
VRGLRGLHGTLRVELLTDRPEERFVPGARLHPEGTTEVLTITEAGAVADGPGWWIRFREIPDRTAADRLRDVYLEIEVDLASESREPGTWLWQDLIGLAVRSSDGRDLGRVHDIYRAGGAEVFIVRGPAGELDVPGVRGIVLDLAPERGELIVDLEALALDARPVDDKPDRPRDRRRTPNPPRTPAPSGEQPAEPTAEPGADPGVDPGADPPADSSSRGG